MMTHRNLIVPLAHVKLADDLCSSIAGDSGSGMFTTRLQPVAGGAATHAIASGMIDEKFAALLPLGTTPGQPEMIYTLAQQAGLDTTVAAITAVLAASDVSTSDPFARMSLLGLKLEQAEI